jgi:thiamine-phosphate pyrophosphorylase
MASSFRLPRVYPLTNVQLSGLSHGEQLHLLTLGGASLVQLREKRLQPLQFYTQAKAAMSVAERDGVQLIINDRVDIALAVGAHGVHLGQDDMPPEAARRLLGPESIIGYSTHSVEQAQKALTLPIDYLAIGPIFETSSKTDTSSTLGLEGLRAVRRVVQELPLVAIGGISAANALSIIAAGADSVAVISALLTDQSRITEAMVEMRKKLG